MMDIFSSIGNVVKIITNNSFIGKIGVGLSAIATAFFTPIVGLLFACFALNAADLFTGIQVAIKQGKKITSRKTWLGTITKIHQESAVIVLLHIIEHFAMASIDTTMLSGSATVLMCLVELWSILENLNTINPEGPWSILKKFLAKKGEDSLGIDLIELDDDTTKDN